MDTKVHKCDECGEEEPQNFYPHMKSRCKACTIKRTVVAHRLKPDYQRKQAIFYRRWYAKNGRRRNRDYSDVIVLWQATHQDSRKATAKVAKAIRQGLLERSLKCEMCGRERCRINGHHNDYDFPYDVIWLCSSCHKKIHLESRLDK